MNDERRTPILLFDALNEKFSFTIDVAATHENALVKRYYDKEMDGLSKSWEGETVWCNPPYSRGQLKKWVWKALTEKAQTVMLLPGDCSTQAGQAALRFSTSILFLDKRLAFDDETSGAKFASWLVLFGGTRRDVANLYLLDMGIVL